jgi:N-acetyl-anhydromuramyl-L-alanine amidase AmpD
MKASSIPTHENTFQTNGVDSAGKKFILKEGTFPIIGTTETVKITICTRDNGDKSFYYQEETAKRKIVLHFTMGYLKGDIATLTKQHVSVPFVLGRNGIIYNLFPSKYWSYHLGPGAIGGNTGMSRESIGIEISNIGPLKLIGDNLVTTYSDTDIYCSLAERQYYTKLPTKYRNYEYFATYTAAQYEALSKLLKFLCAKYSLPKNFLNEPERYEVMTDAAFKNYSGIVTHVNCRPDKVDIGPAFDWNKVLLGVNGK